MDWAISEKGYTQRKACDLVGLEPKTYRYQSCKPDDTALRKRLCELARANDDGLGVAVFTCCWNGRASS